MKTYTSEPLSLGHTPRINQLPLLKPTRLQNSPHRKQPGLILNLKLHNDPLRRHTLLRKHAQHRRPNPMRFPRPNTYLHSPIPVLLRGLVAHDLASIDLQHCARYTRASLRVKHRGHALLRSQQACPQGRGVLLAFVGLCVR